jgi:RNA polymerase sigma-70 factor, ECF subfamily
MPNRNSGLVSMDALEKVMESIGNTQDCFLVRAAQGGNQAAFERLVRAHDQAVLGLALRLTGSESDAQDIHQEAFLKAYNNLGDFRFECSFSTWIYRIVTNVCLDHLRRKQSLKRNRATEVDVDLVSDDRPVNNPEQELLRQELSEHIVRALRRLTPRERMIFELKHFQGMKLRAVSGILNSSEGSVKTSFFRATKKLRLELARYTKRNQSSIKQRSAEGMAEAAVLQKVKRVVAATTSAAALDTPGSELRTGTMDRIFVI